MLVNAKPLIKSLIIICIFKIPTCYCILMELLSWANLRWLTWFYPILPITLASKDFLTQCFKLLPPEWLRKIFMRACCINNFFYLLIAYSMSWAERSWQTCRWNFESASFWLLTKSLWLGLKYCTKSICAYGLLWHILTFFFEIWIFMQLIACYWFF